MGDRATKDSETIGDFLRRAQTDKSRAKSDGQSCLPERDKNKLPNLEAAYFCVLNSRSGFKGEFCYQCLFSY
jgi:hypothetical protein